MTVAALYVDPAGVYADLPDVEVWDEQRDARLYVGPWPVVAHPPCSSWCQLAHVNQARWGFRIGNDGGCFAAALNAVRAYGGVLEHPAYTLAWERHRLSKPPARGWAQSFFDPGWVTEVSQSAYGHPARKRTWLYYVGTSEPVDLKWHEPRVHAGKIGGNPYDGENRVDRYEASRTPEEFRDMLLTLARASVAGADRQAI